MPNIELKDALDANMRTTPENPADGQAYTVGPSAALVSGAAAGTAAAASLASHVANTSNPHSVTAAQAGADPAGTAASAVAAHVAATNPHTQYVRATTAELHIYVNGTSGNDANTGLSQGQAVQTGEAVDALIPIVVQHDVHVHCAAGTITCNTRDYWLSARILQGARIHVYADEAWDPTVYTVRTSGVAAAGTGSTKVVTSGGLTTDVQSGYTVEFTSGNCAGQKRTIVRNDATTYYPADRFDPMWTSGDPAPGDSYRVTSNAVVISSTSAYFSPVQPCAGASPDAGSHVQFTGVSFGGTGALVLDGVVRLVGVQTSRYAQTAEQAWVSMGDARYHYNADRDLDGDLTEWNKTLGWGFTTFYSGSASAFGGREGVFSGAVDGYLHAAGGSNLRTISARGALYGGRVRTLSYCGLSDVIGGWWSGSADNALRVDRDCTLTSDYESTKRIYLASVAFGGTFSTPRLTAGDGATVYLASSVTGESSGTTTISAKRGGRVLCDGAPALGKSSGDDIAADSLAVNKSIFSSEGVGSARIGELGGLVTRIV